MVVVPSPRSSRVVYSAVFYRICSDGVHYFSCPVILVYVVFAFRMVFPHQLWLITQLNKLLNNHHDFNIIYTTWDTHIIWNIVIKTSSIQINYLIFQLEPLLSNFYELEAFGVVKGSSLEEMDQRKSEINQEQKFITRCKAAIYRRPRLHWTYH
jgi:hypothetical protein